MRKLILLAFAVLPFIARGQSNYFDYYGWFDDNPQATISGRSTNANIKIDADVTGLTNTIHTLHFRICDNNGLWSEPITKYFLVGNIAPDESLTTRYWFDDQKGEYKDLTGNIVNVDVSSLDVGLHTLHIQAMDQKQHSDFASSTFFRSKTNVGRTEKIRYWFDNQKTEYEELQNGELCQIDVNGLVEGLHEIHIQTYDSLMCTDYVSQYFYIIPKTKNNLTYLCVVDGKVVDKKTTTTETGVINWNIDVQSLDMGLHVASLLVLTEEGKASSVTERYFIREVSQGDVDNLRLCYIIDGDEAWNEAGKCQNGLYQFNLDVDKLSTGIHQITYMMVTEAGFATEQRTSMFYKNPREMAITNYEYWINENEDAKHIVTLSKYENPFSLIGLLPVETQAIRSSSFHFENKDNQPKIYAKNEIHFTFHDTFDKSVETSKCYLDYNVSQTVVPISELKEVFGKVSMERLGSNAINWYTMNCQRGDSIAVKASQATSIQIFAPSGEEVYNVSGSESVVLGGLHAKEDGTYYFAIHDVTGSKANVTMDYQHIDKYAVLDWDVHTVGNGGCSTITFNGNGFKDLYAVDLYNAEGDTIHQIEKGYAGNAEVPVVFDFYGAALGEYSALLHFTEGELIVKKFLIVEEPRKIEITTGISYPSSFLSNTSAPYAIRITNKGNMTAYNVPLYTYIQSNTQGGITYIKYHGMDFPNVFSEIDTTYLSSSELAELIQYGETLGDDIYFLKGKMPSENNNDSVFVRTNYSFVTLPPNSSQTFVLQIFSHEDFEVSFSVPDDWFVVRNEDSDDIPNAKNNFHLKFSSAEDLINKYNCYTDHVECGLQAATTVLDATAAALGTAGFFTAATGFGAAATPWLEGSAATTAVASCVTSIVNDKFKIFNSSLNAHKESYLPFNVMYSTLKSVVTPLNLSTFISCAGSALSVLGAKKKLTGPVMDWVIREIGLHVSLGSLVVDANNQKDCKKRSLEKKPGCPPNPPKCGRTIKRESIDPNDIYGFISESGSKFVCDTVVTVPYRIEFENDTAFATASAHTVIVKDTLDASKFDLMSYQPTSIKIGDKDVQLTGDKNFVKTVDMRPDIYAIAQVEGTYDEKNGIATWKFTSLDPMTMEETDDVMQGFLPINYNGNGIGEVAYNINLKSGLTNGTHVENRASIVFDSNAPIMTPTWTNIVDATGPTSTIASCVLKNDTTALLKVRAKDNLSGVWKYSVYVQYGAGSPWFSAVEGSTDSIINVRIYKGIDQGFYVVATDSAGNVEKKEAMTEAIVGDYIIGDVNSDKAVDVVDVSSIAAHILGYKPEPFNAEAADINQDKVVDVVDISSLANYILNNGTLLRSDALQNIVAEETPATLKIDPFSIKAGEEMDMEIVLNNPSYTICGTQYDIYLPAGFNFVMDEYDDPQITTLRSTKITTDGSIQEDGALRVLSYSSKNYTYSDTEGAIATVRIQPDGALPAGVYTIELKNACLSKLDKGVVSKVVVADSSVSVTVSAGETGVDGMPINANHQPSVIYNLAGQRILNPQKGVNIKDKKKILY